MTQLPESVSFGDNLDLTSAWADVTLTVELPFWLLIPNGELNVVERGHGFTVALFDSFVQVFAGVAADSRVTVAYEGPIDGAPNAVARVVSSGRISMYRKCRTVLRIKSRAVEDVLRARTEKGGRARTADHYFVALCSAHLPVVNRLVHAYRSATYDPMAHEISPWDAPIWFVRANADAWRVCILEEAERDERPVQKDFSKRDDPAAPWEVVQLTDVAAVKSALEHEPVPAEVALRDADSLLHRGCAFRPT
jgi:hypothetical protein